MRTEVRGMWQDVLQQVGLGRDTHGDGEDMTLTKAQIAEEVWSKTDIPKWRSAKLVDSVFETIKRTLESGEDVLISGFGKFSVRKKRKRRGRNPQTGEPITLAPRKVIIFKYSGRLKDTINGRR